MKGMRIFLSLTLMIGLVVCSTPEANTFPSQAQSLASTPTQAKQDLPEVADRSYAQNFKDSALAFCIAKAYQSEPGAANDALATAGGIVNWTSYDIEKSTGEVPKLVEQFLGRQYGSHLGPGTRLDLLKCIDMYHSKELAALVKRYVPHPTRTYRQDNPPSKQ